MGSKDGETGQRQAASVCSCEFSGFVRRVYITREWHLLFENISFL